MPRCHVVLLWALLFTFLSLSASARTLELDAPTLRFSASPYARVVEDPSGTLAIDDIRQLADSRWATHPVTVYGPLAGESQTFQTGDLLPFAQRPVPHRNFVFPLALQPDEPATLYIRLESAGTLTVPMVLWQSVAFATHTQATYALLAIYCGILIALGGYNLLLYFALRDSAYLAYVAYVLAMLVWQASLNGIANQYLWPDSPRWGNAAVASAFAAAGCLGAIFTRIFLRTALAAPVVDKVVLAFVAGLAFAAAAPLFMPYRVAVLLTSLLGTAFALVAALAGWLCWQRKVAGARWFLLGWVILLAGVIVQVLRSFDVVPTNVFTSEAMQFSSSLEMLLLSFALADRLLVADRERKLAQADALEAKEELVRSMGESERRLESRVVERTRDLASANRELERARAKLEQLAHYDQLTQLPNRLMLKERLELSVAHALGRRAAFAVLWMDLDGFKAINDMHGHMVGDEVLRILSRRMLENCSPPDLIVRFGGDEFIAVLDRGNTIAAAGEAAQRLIDAIHREVHIDGRRLALQASVGIALYPEHGADGQTLLERADRAMYAAKAAGGSCWREASESDALLRA